MAPSDLEDSGPSLIARIVIGVVVVFVALSIVGWLIGAVLGAIKFLVVVGGAIAVIWAIASARADRS